jgi:hypothetical protein
VFVHSSVNTTTSSARTRSRASLGTSPPAASHAAVDGLSQRKRVPEDTDEEDAEEYLDKFTSTSTFSSCSVSSLTNFLSSESLHSYRPTRLNNDFLRELLLVMRRTPQTPFASFRTSSVAEDLSILQTENPTPAFASELQRLRETDFDFADKDSNKGSLVKCSLLSVTDNFSYTG